MESLNGGGFVCNIATYLLYIILLFAIIIYIIYKYANTKFLNILTNINGKIADYIKSQEKLSEKELLKENISNNTSQPLITEPKIKLPLNSFVENEYYSSR
jgi:predicted PurR-regulated permease PerM